MSARTWYLSENNFTKNSHCVPGTSFNDEDLLLSKELLRLAMNETGHRMGGYRITAPAGEGGSMINLRGQKVLANGSITHILREMPDFLPELSHPKLNYNASLQEILLNPNWLRGGLVLISGSGGSGKSTTMTAMLVSRLKRFGGVAITIEDPPEYDTGGKHNDGLCLQFSAENDGDFALRVRDALRCYPVSTKGAILFLSEIRSPNVAAIAVESALSGHLVLATIHAMSLETAVSRLCSMAGQVNGDTSVRQDVAETLRAVVYQSMSHGRISVETLLSSETTVSVQAKIRDGLFHHLTADIHRQKTLILNGKLPI